MDDLVKQAMTRWPDVPAVEGWLRLDQRGVWYLIDRNQPGFDPERDAHGSPITNTQIVDYIGRNYEAERDAQGRPTGRWYWQNGPQRVFVSYTLAPLVLRILQDKNAPESPHAQRLMTHTGYLVDEVRAVCVKDTNHLLINTNLGPGILHDLDLAQVDLEWDSQDQPIAVTLLGKRWPLQT